MLPVIIVDFVVFGTGAYLVYRGETSLAIAFFVVGFLASGLMVMQMIRRRSTAGNSGRAFPAGFERLQSEQVTLEPNLEEAVRVIAETSKIEAIKRVRELTGASLRAAKEYVDQIS